MLQRLPLLALAAVLALSGCVGGNTRQSTPPPELMARAEGQRAAGRPGAAAETYLEAAAAVSGSTRADLRLRAAAAFLDGGLTQRAREVLEDTRLPRDAGAELDWRMAVARARLALAEGRSGEALGLVEGTPPPAVAAPVLRTRAEAHAAAGAPLAAAAARSALDRYLEGAAAVANRDALWEQLEQAEPGPLDARATTAAEPFRGWLELALVTRGPGASALQRLQEWKRAHPEHPARAERYGRLEEAVLLDGNRPRHVALLLPADGPFAEAAAAVRDGFLAAWFQDPAADRPRVSLFSDAPAALWGTYQQALSAGADFVVGPLNKDSVNLLRQSGQLPLRTLALNYAEGPAPQGLTPSGLYQFGLSPENEAREVAARAWFEGLGTALVLAPQGEWGGRVEQAFSHEWREMGGILAETARYTQDAQAISETVARLLNVDASAARARALQAYLGRRLEHQARPRGDADFVFLAAFPQAARQIRPQLRFHRAGDLPALATSHVYRGSPNPGADQDLNGVVFADMPWVLAPDRAEPRIQDRIQAAWPQRHDRFRRLFALGVDAYRVLPHLGRMAAYPATRLDGVSGRLGLDPAYRVHRELTWARFEDGLPQPLDPPAEAAEP